MLPCYRELVADDYLVAVIGRNCNLAVKLLVLIGILNGVNALVPFLGLLALDFLVVNEPFEADL